MAAEGERFVVHDQIAGDYEGASDDVVVQLGNIPEFIAVVCALFRAQLVPVYALPAGWTLPAAG